MQATTKQDYIKAYKDQVIVVKCGGETLESVEVLNNVIDQILELAQNDVKIILVHGGGKQIKERAEARGIPETKERGVRITCKDTLAVVEQVMQELNDDFVSLFQEKVESAQSSLGIYGCAAAEFVTATRQDHLGYVGEPSHVDTQKLRDRLTDTSILILHPVSRDLEGQTLNVNADSVASAIATNVKARRAIFCTSVPGVLDQGGNVISYIKAVDIDRYVDDGTISGGMEKKIRECASLLNNVDGVAVIGTSAEEQTILDELYGQGSGTLISA